MHFCIVQWMRENNWIESCPWIKRERYMPKNQFFVSEAMHFFCIRMRCVSCTKIAFRVFFVVVAICLFCSMPVVCSVRHTLEISLKKQQQKMYSHYSPTKNMKLFIRFWVRQKSIKILKNRHFQYFMLKTTQPSKRDRFKFLFYLFKL